MKALSKLKDDARRHEQRGEWEKAIKVYLQVLAAADAAEGGEIELPLYNRVGDLCVRLGRHRDAVTYYEQAADRYSEAGLYNNAIALCNKALRYLPERVELLRKLGQFSASQGFLTDARRYFLDFAEKRFSAGATDEAIQALRDYANVAGDAEIRELLGRKLRTHNRTPEAIAELKRAYALRLGSGEPELAASLRREILSLDPSAFDDELAGGTLPMQRVPPVLPGVADRLPDLNDSPAPGQASTDPDEGLHVEGFGYPGADELEPEGGSPTALLEGFETTGLADARPQYDLAAMQGLQDLEAAPEFAATPEFSRLEELDPAEFEAPDVSDFEQLPDLDLERPDLGLDDRAGLELDDRAGLGLDDRVDLELDDRAGLELDDRADLELDDRADLELDDRADLELDDRADLDLDGRTVGEPSEEPALDLDSFAPGALDDEAYEAAGGTLDEVLPPDLDVQVPDEVEDDGRELAASLPLLDDVQDLELAPPELELPDFEVAGDVELLGGDLEPLGDDLEPIPEDLEPLPELPMLDTGDAAPAPPAPADFVDLGSLVIEEPAPSGETRFTLEEQTPTGDEDDDFAELLSQFRQKVAENVAPEDAAAHYDLGLAFKDMGLLDEAISELQVALHAGDMRLKVYEELGLCFLLKNEYSIAEKVLRRALEMKYQDELELIGVYFHLGRAYEALGKPEQARDAYERVLALDINFGDVAERIERL